MTAVRVQVPGKLNLLLRVGPRRADGFHDLVTVFHAVDVHDEVTARPVAELRVVVTGTTGGVPADATNLAARAAAALAAEVGRSPAVELTISKSIPVAAGLAGGSADAAAALVACAQLWGVERARLAAVAASVGSDVAFALLGGTAIGTGRGEVLRALPAHRPLHWVLLPAGFGLSTPAVYAELDRRRPAAHLEPAATDALAAALAGGDPEAVAAALGNDLEAAAVALAPSLAGTLDAARAAGALAAIVSGSGPTVAALTRDPRHASDVAERLRAARPDDPAPLIARGAVPGALIMAT